MPPNSNDRDKNEALRVGLPHPQTAEMGLGERVGPSAQPWTTASPRPEKRGISLVGWGIGALVSLGLWAAIFFLIR
jgi:hypothetical protein